MHAVNDDWAARKQVLDLTDGRQLAFVHAAEDGPALLLIHGYTDSSRSYAGLSAMLPGFNLVIPDLPGHGASSARQQTGITGYACDIETLIDHLGLERLIIVGHSMGGMIATELAAKLGDRVEALVILASSLTPAMPDDGFLAMAIERFSDPIDPADPFFDDWHGCARPVDPAFLAVARREAAAMPADVWRRIFKGMSSLDLRKLAGTVTCPVLALSGADDPLFGPDEQARLVAAFPNARGRTLAGHGHNLHWEDPALVAKLLRDLAAPDLRD